MALLVASGVLSLLSTSVVADSLAEVEHVIYFMQENRAFDHYFGTLKGVRGYSDPNVLIGQDGKSAFYQKVNGTLTNETDHLLPWYLNYLGGDYLESTQCGGSILLQLEQTDGVPTTELLTADRTYDLWAIANTAFSWSHYRREDIPVHFAIADAWTIGDMYQEAIVSSSEPNRFMWQTGTINLPGSKINSTAGPCIDDNSSPGCVQLFRGGPQPPWGQGTTPVGQFNGSIGPASALNYSCYPYDWKTVPEYFYEDGVNITWNQYHSSDNYGHEIMEYFVQFQDLIYPGNETEPIIVAALNEQGHGADTGGVEAFLRDAQAGNLPEISYLIAPGDLCEHPPNLPRQGGWLQKAVIDAVQNSPKYNKTILIISYDETGGFGDHVVPFHSPEGTPGEWLNDPFTGVPEFGGPGFRVPFFVISPWTRGGGVFTEPADHISQLLFMEKWAAARGKGFHIEAISDWRREHMSDLLDIFDWDHPNYTAVELPDAPSPQRDPLSGLLDAAAYCHAKYDELAWPPVPYGNQTEQDALWVEAGHREIRGKLTEGRHLVLESSGYALSVLSNATCTLGTSSPQVQKESDASQRFIVHARNASLADVPIFTITSAGDSKWFQADLSLSDSNADAAYFNVTNGGGVKGYTFQEMSSGQYLNFGCGNVTLGASPEWIKLYSVTF
ncbi:phosphoesterase family-domain-containing protein [Kockovaella imperatae]|uniref:Phosphoesterase family-domain-containing protein n=1 Tax=Kockovaella imperatae TaxID=4999 RepID=A0A1Y1UGI2_9TREE|nr:phosphoesterase family-domain-containing protein [Kockovaella imperatae]ORX37170.1 phosphoesterase family-domain-containing protein [Kockovaella imperatae]